MAPAAPTTHRCALFVALMHASAPVAGYGGTLTSGGCSTRGSGTRRSVYLICETEGAAQGNHACV
jgi:hypothetical protein